jgi:hypothetical protein
MDARLDSSGMTVTRRGAKLIVVTFELSARKSTGSIFYFFNLANASAKAFPIAALFDSLSFRDLAAGFVFF